MNLKQLLLSGLLTGLLTQAAWAGDTTPVLEHRLERGQTMHAVSRLYGVTVESLRQANPDLVPENLAIGTRLRIPVPPAGWAHHTLACGEDLAAVAAHYGLPVEQLLVLNPAGAPAEGQEVLLPRPLGTPLAAAPEAAVTPAAPPATLPEGAWLEVHLSDGTRAWAPRTALLVGSRSPLNPDGMLGIARRFVGTPYRWGGQTPNGVDCSGYVQEVFDLAGYRLPRLADEQYAATLAVDTSEARPGDLVFFTTYLPGPSHVGIYLGDGRFLHASSSRGVIEARLDEEYFATRCLGIRRIKPWVEIARSAPEPPRAAPESSAQRTP